MYSPTPIASASPRAQGLSHEVTALINERRGQDPSLGLPEALVALELAKASLLEGAGVGAGGRVTAILVAVVALVVAGFAFFLTSQ